MVNVSERITSSVRQVWIARPEAHSGPGSRRDGKRRRGEQQAQTLNLMRAAWRLERLARFLERDYESAARSLREGMAEMLTYSGSSCRPRCTNAGRRPT
jgi:hypothetical protein